MTLDRSRIYTMLGSPIVRFLCFAFKKKSLIKFLLAILGDLRGMKGERDGERFGPFQGSHSQRGHLGNTMRAGFQVFTQQSSGTRLNSVGRGWAERKENMKKMLHLFASSLAKMKRRLCVGQQTENAKRQRCTFTYCYHDVTPYNAQNYFVTTCM